MNVLTIPTPASGIIYPESDGKPMSDHTKQFRWIVVVFANLAAVFQDQASVFVGGNLLWYPVEGHPEICNAPDVFVVFGRPKGDRSSYKQWEEDHVPMTVVFEILSPGNTFREMDEKYDFYEQHGVEEYYCYDPDTNHLVAYLRRGEVFRKVRPVANHVSPRLGIRFDLSGPEMVIYRPNGRPFLTFEELEQRAARLAFLSRRARRGEASEAELRELEQLEEQLLPPHPG
jgi:Uma2 family endonuclease